MRVYRKPAGNKPMMQDSWQRVDDLLQSVIDCEPSQRASFLDVACAGDEAIRQQVEALLAADREASDFLERPAVEAGASLATEWATASQAGRLIGAYRILRELGCGGMGTVYLAERADEQFSKQVAIKLVKRGMDSDAILQRFRGERQILATLDHPHIASLLDAGTTDDGLSYFIMEYVEGQPIDVYCTTRRLSTRERLHLFVRVCAAVQHAHEHHVVHRDLKPTNILVTEDRIPKLLDFGIAKLLAPANTAATASTTTIGLRPMTPAYASPEQVRGEPVTPASDVYALGVLLYELLTGRRPYDVGSTSAAALARAVCEQEPQRPSTAVSRCAQTSTVDSEALDVRTLESPRLTRSLEAAALRRALAGDLDNITMMALRKEPSRRYRSVAQFAEDVRRHLEGRPVLARGNGLAYRGGRFVTRNKTAVMSAVAGVIATVAAVAVAPLLSRDQGLSARAVTRGIAVAIAPQEDTPLAKTRFVDPEAQRLFEWGRLHLAKRTKAGMTSAINYFERAIERDSSYAPAYASLALTYWLSADGYAMLPFSEALSKARAAALRALQLDATLPEAHMALGNVLLWADWDWTGAGQAYQRAIEMNPASVGAHHAYSLYLTLAGRLDEALREAKRAVELDPFALAPNSYLAWAYYRSRKLDEALEQTRVVLELDPNYDWRPAGLRGHVFLAKGMYGEAIREYEKVAASPHAYDTRGLAWLGHARARSGDTRGARALLEEIRRIAKRQYVPAIHLVLVYVGLGDSDQAFAWLEKAYAAREPAVVWLRTNPLVDGLRSDPRYTDLLRRIGQP